MLYCSLMTKTHTMHALHQVIPHGIAAGRPTALVKSSPCFISHPMLNARGVNWNFTNGSWTFVSHKFAGDVWTLSSHHMVSHEHHGVSTCPELCCLFNILLTLAKMKASKLPISGPLWKLTDGFSYQMASDAKRVSKPWRQNKGPGRWQFQRR